MTPPSTEDPDRPNLMAERPSLLIAGATGLVGRHVVTSAVASPRFGRIVTIGRRRLSEDVLPNDVVESVEQHVVDYDALDASTGWADIDVVICALGTTMKRAGGKARFRMVDYDYPLALARHVREKGARHFILVSSMGADPESRIFYSRVKGEVEQDLRKAGFDRLTLARPTLLLGERDESRFGEDLARRLRFVMRGKYRPIAAADVADALLESVTWQKESVRILEAEELRSMAQRFRDS